MQYIQKIFLNKYEKMNDRGERGRGEVIFVPVVSST